MLHRIAFVAQLSALVFAQGWNQPSLSPRPPAAFGAAMGFHEQRAELVWFGGATSTAAWPPSVLQQTWVFGNGTWAQRTPSLSPPARQRHSMCYDRLGQRVYLFGGLDAFGLPLNDIWWFDGTDWFTASHGTVPPTARADAALLATPSLQLVGGWSPVAGHLADAWVGYLNGTLFTWSPLPAFPAAPRRGAALAEMYWPEPPPVHGAESLLLHGGRDDTQVFSDTWLLRPWPVGWQLLSPAGGPARAGHAMHRHSSERMVLLAGGVDTPTGAPLDDVWRFDGQRWLELHPPVRPPAVIAPATAWDAGRTRLVRVGGRDASGSLDAHWEFEPLRLDPEYFGTTCNTLGLSATLLVQPASRSANWDGQFYISTGNNMTFALFVVGFSNQSWGGLPLSLAALGLPQCQLLVEPAWTQLAPLTPVSFGFGSVASLLLPIPITPSLYGVELFAQALSGNSFGVHIASNGARVTIW